MKTSVSIKSVKTNALFANFITFLRLKKIKKLSSNCSYRPPDNSGCLTKLPNYYTRIKTFTTDSTVKSALTNTVALMNEDPLVPLSGTDVVFMTGLGKTDNARFPTSLQGLYTFYLEDCYSTVPFYDPIYHVCTQANPSSFGGCEGDAGSPLVMPSSRTLVALHGFADDVCEKQTVNGNTRISTYAGWVKEQICDISATKPSYCTSTKDGCLLTNILDEVSNTFTGAFSKLSSVFRGGA